MRFRGEDGLVVLARHPEPGRVKTRLAARLGAEAAARLYRAFLLDLERTIGRDPRWELLWAYEPREAPFSASLGSAAPAVPQEEGSLGARMAGAMAAAFARDARRVVLIGSDVPHLDPEAVADAFARLRGGADLVLGPAEDGGYYLIGASGVPPVFDGVRWGGSDVLRETLRRAAALGLRAELVAGTYDVDEEADVRRLLADPALVRLPATRRALAPLSRGRLAGDS
jgi:rSAM/selenodomain-associated transferase 1